jgi:hypothetical protein
LTSALRGFSAFADGDLGPDVATATAGSEETSRPEAEVSRPKKEKKEKKKGKEASEAKKKVKITILVSILYNIFSSLQTMRLNKVECLYICR